MKNNELTIKSLRADGHKVRVSHNRRVVPDLRNYTQKVEYVHIGKGKFSEVSSKQINITVPTRVLGRGGETVVEVDTTDGKNFKVNALCSNKEAYNKKRGVAICLGRIARDMKAAENN